MREIIIKMKKYLFEYGLPLLIFCGVMYFAVTTTIIKSIKESRLDTKGNFNAIQKNVDSIFENQKEIDKRLLYLTDAQLELSSEVDKNTRAIQQNTNSVINLRRSINEKVNSVNTYNYKQLNDVFSRYNK
jgi:hypothetical protein